jgi:sugar diacid utilization regulator
MLVVAAVPATPEGDPDAASGALARAVLGDTRTLVVVRQGEIVAVPALGPGCDPERVCERVDAVHARLREEGLPLAIGISTAAEGVRELPRAYAEAHAAVGWSTGGVAALPRLSPFHYLTQSAPATARRLVDPALRELDVTARETVRALAAADLQIAGAARLLQVHPNTAQYRLRRIEERTGRNPRRISDLIELLVAMALEE